MKKFFKGIISKQTGFTLIELLVVIAIIGILAAIIVPNVSKYISGGTDAANKAELTIVQNAVFAAMASARVDNITSAGTVAGPTGEGLTDGTDFNVLTGATTTDPDSTNKALVGTYLGGGVDKLTVDSSYTITTEGVVTRP